MKIARLLLVVLVLAFAKIGWAQAMDSAFRTRALDSLLQWHAFDTIQAKRIRYSDFIGETLAHNLDYAVQKYNISAAQAAIEVAKLYPDPAISAAFSKDVTGGLPSDSMGGSVLSFGASQTILLGGKVANAVRIASQNRSAAEATVQDFFWTLRASATQAYITAAIADSDYAEAVRTYQNLATLTEIDAHRVTAGDIAQTDYVQSRVDAMQTRGAVLQADAARRTAFLALGELMGKQDGLYRPGSNIIVPARTFDLDALIERADTARWDVTATRAQMEAARLGIDLARAMRWPDVTVGLGYSTTAGTAALPSPFPNQNVLGVNISVPFPLSAAINHGTLDVAETNYEQMRDSLAALRLNVETSIRQAFEQYRFARQEYEQYSRSLLHDAQAVWEARLYSYKAGNAELLDVLTAQNTFASVYQAYYSALAGYANALVNLEATAQVWDMEF